MWLAASALLTTTQLWHPSGDFGDLLYLLVAAGAATAAWIGVRWCRGHDREVGVLFAAAITISGLGDLVSRVIGWRTGAEPQASVADLAWIATYALLGVGLLLLLRRGDRDQRRDIDGLIDVGAVSVAGMMVVWALAVAATLADATLPVAIRVLWGMYPVLDLAILALVLRLLIRDRTVAVPLVAGGAGLWLGADVAYLAIADAASYSVLLDAAWLWGMILLALAVVVGPATPLRRGAGLPGPAVDETGLGRISLALLPLLVPSLIELQWFVRGHDGTTLAVTLPGAVLLVGLAFVRMARLASSARRARGALVSQERYASALAANSSDAVAVLDADRRLVDNFPRLAALADRPTDSLRGTDFLSLAMPEDRAAIQMTVRRCLARPGQVFQFEVRLGGDRGHPVWCAARAVNLLSDPDVHGIVVNLHDISDRKRAEVELSHQAFHDALTGLANRALFRDRLNHALERVGAAGPEPAVIFLDLDGFKAVNDRLGHDLGDDLLREVATRLTAAVSRSETVGRLGGDEFGILIDQADGPLAEATATADRVLAALRAPVSLDEHRVNISASAGIALGDRISGSASVLRNADVAMYRSKSQGKDRWTVYRPGMRTAARERLEWQNAMYAALEQQEFRLVYQPIIDLDSERVVGFEGLVRWQRPGFGLLVPDRFVSLAEASGLIVPIGRWVLQEATRVAARWHRDAAPAAAPTMAVNLSARQLAAPDLVMDVGRALTTAGLPPDNLVLEITETALVDDAVVAADRLRDLKRLGVRLAIDDFGTGYSSLSYLRHFPVDILKIDRSFVCTIPEQGEFPPIVRGLLELGRALHMETLAEGVERDFQRNRLRDQHCDLAQGYFIAPPMSEAEAEQVLRRQADKPPILMRGVARDDVRAPGRSRVV
jgi:diguanylate cyclase (GGDEF)-like protein/PAS domain S-box-containing protein